MDMFLLITLLLSICCNEHIHFFSNAQIILSGWWSVEEAACFCENGNGFERLMFLDIQHIQNIQLMFCVQNIQHIFLYTAKWPWF